MATERDTAIWKQILQILDEKLQLGVLQQSRAVVDYKFEAEHLTLFVATDEAFDFFNSEINQQRLIILSRPAIWMEKVSVERVEAEPL